MPDKICFLMGTRGRPANMSKMWSAAYSMAEDKQNIEIVWYIDNDDLPSLNRAHELSMCYGTNKIKWVMGPRIIMSDMQNECVKKTDANILAVWGDDVFCLTPRWDEKVREAFSQYEDKMCLVGGNDLSNYNLFTHFFLHRNFYNLMGWIIPNGYVADYIDNHLWDLFGLGSLDRRIKVDAIFEHKHWSIKDKNGQPKTQMDKTYQEKNVRGYSGPITCDAHFRNQRPEIERQAKILNEYIRGYKEKLDNRVQSI